MNVITDSTPPAASTRRLSWPRAVAAGIFASIAVEILLTFQDYGISWDEQLQNTYGEKLLSYYTSGFEDESAFSYINLFLYGGFFDMTAAIANLISPFGMYETRHLLGGMMFLVGLWGAWKLAYLLANERAALMAVICLATTPLLYGHGFINPKDSPLAWLGIWTTYFACRILAAPGAHECLSWRTIIGFGVSLGLTIGTRVIGVVYIGYLASIFVVAAVARALGGEPVSVMWQRMRSGAAPLTVAALLAVAVMGFMWPWAMQEPLNIAHAFRSFAHFAFYPNVLWNGQLIPANQMPLTYLPGLMLFQLPEYVLLGMVIAVSLGVMAFCRRPLTLFTEPLAQQYLYVMASFGAPLLGYLILQPTVYNGLRHFLFTAPPLVILGAIGLERGISFLLAKHRIAGLALTGVLSLGALRQVWLMAGLHPYEYVAYNSIVGGIKGAANRFELDYWGLSLAESARSLAAYINKDQTIGVTTGVIAKVFACGDRTSVEPFLPPGTAFTEDLREADFYLGMTGVHCQEPIGKPYLTIFEVKRLGVTLGYVRDLRASAP
jgi:Dolichyl-phosphate-mannose-protein mannosyltransferase